MTHKRTEWRATAFLCDCGSLGVSVTPSHAEGRYGGEAHVSRTGPNWSDLVRTAVTELAECATGLPIGDGPCCACAMSRADEDIADLQRRAHSSEAARLELEEMLRVDEEMEREIAIILAALEAELTPLPHST